MKSTYKLIGLFWDGKPEANYSKDALPYDSSYLALGSQPCLFDLLEKKRKVNLSELFSINTSNDFDAMVNKLKDCGSVALIIDYLPTASSAIHRKFALHRTLQVFGALQNALPESKVIMMRARPMNVAA